MLVNELVTKFTFDVGRGFKNYESKLKKQARATDRATKRMGRMFSSLGRSIGQNLKARMVIHGARRAKGELKGINSLAKSIKTNLLGLAAGYAGFQGLSNVMSRTLKVGAETEQLFAGLSTLRGPQQARRDMKDLQVMAASTPFKVNELTESFMRLNAAGFNVDINAMKKLGDLAAGTVGQDMKKLTDTMLSASRGQGAMIDNFNGMAGKAEKGNLAVSAYDSKTKKMIKTTIKAGDKAALLGFYLKAAVRQDTIGSMERLSQTSKGLASTLSDNIDLALLNFYKGFEGALKDSIVSMTGMAKSAQGLGRDFGVFIKLNLPSIIKNVTSAFRALKPILIGVGAAWLLLKTYMVSSAIMDASSGAIMLMRSMMGLRSAIQAMSVAHIMLTASEAASTAGAWALNIAIGFIPALIAAAVAAVGVLAYDFYQFATTGDSMLLRFTENWPILHGVIKTAHTLILSFGMAFENLGQKWATTLDAMGEATSYTFGLMSQNWTNTMNIMSEYGSEILANMSVFFAAWVQTTMALFQTWVAQGLQKWNAFKMAAVDAGNGVKASIMGALNSIGNFLASLPAKAIAAFQGLLSAARNAAANMPVIGSVMAKLPGFATGGMVPGGYPNDSFVAGLTSGEAIIPTKAVQQIKAGDPSGFAKVAEIVKAPMSVPVAQMGGMSAPGQPATYDMPAAQMVGGSSNHYSNSVNAPISQTFNITAANQPTQTARAVATQSTNGIRKELDFVSRQTPRRVPRP